MEVSLFFLLKKCCLVYQIILSLNITNLPVIHFYLYFETILQDTYPSITKFTLPIYIMYELIFSAFFSFSVHCWRVAPEMWGARGPLVWSAGHLHPLGPQGYWFLCRKVSQRVLNSATLLFGSNRNNIKSRTWDFFPYFLLFSALKK